MLILYAGCSLLVLGLSELSSLDKFRSATVSVSPPNSLRQCCLSSSIVLRMRSSKYLSSTSYPSSRSIALSRDTSDYLPILLSPSSMVHFRQSISSFSLSFLTFPTSKMSYSSMLLYRTFRIASNSLVASVDEIATSSSPRHPSIRENYWFMDWNALPSFFNSFSEFASEESGACWAMCAASSCYTTESSCWNGLSLPFALTAMSCADRLTNAQRWSPKITPMR